MAETQPDPAVRLVIDFLNTLDVEENSDALADPASYRQWVTAHAQLPVASVDVRELTAARDLRATLRDTVLGEPSAPPPAPPLRLTITDDGDAVLAADDAPGAVAAAVATLAIRGQWRRIKICPADDCRWAFYDASRNHSRQWCSMAVCGNRAKARAHRERAR